MALQPPDRFLDYIVCHECGASEWKENKATQVAGMQPGEIRNYVKWDAAALSVATDAGGPTHVGVTQTAGKSYGIWPITTQQDWINFVGKFWDAVSAGEAANYACACMMYQAQWGGCSRSKIIDELRKVTDKQDEASKITGSSWKTIAQLTHCCTNPMNAYLAIRKGWDAHCRSCSSPSTGWAVNGNGWSRRILGLCDDGLYIEFGSSKTTKLGSLNYEQLCEKMKEFIADGTLQLLMKWDGTPSVSSSFNGEGSVPGSGGTVVAGGSSYVRGQDYGGRSIKEGNPNTVYNLAYCGSEKQHVLSLNDTRRKQFTEMRQTMVEQTPNREREIIISEEMYNPSILKGSQRSKEYRGATQIVNNKK